MLARAGLALFTLAACSACAAALAGGRRVAPGSADLALAFAAALGAAAWAAALPWGRALAVAAAAGAVAALPGAWARAREAGARPGAEAEGSAWKRFARAMGNYQSRLLLGGVYFVLLAPFALAARFAANPLAAPPQGVSRWRPRAAPGDPLADARRQG